MPQEKIDLVLSVIAASLFVLLLVIALLILFRIFLKRKNKLLLEQERMSVMFEQTLLRSKLEIQEDTFTTISREIHDNIGQVLSMVRLNLNTLDHSKEQDKINLLDELMEKAIGDLRSLSHSLNSETLRGGGWIKAVERLFTDLRRTGKYNVEVSIGEDLPSMGEERPIILYRMIQEIINNIIKHSGATAINFSARGKEGMLEIAIADNGRGFDTTKVKDGNGLLNLKDRTAMIDGKLNIKSEAGNGTTVFITVNNNQNG